MRQMPLGFYIAISTAAPHIEPPARFIVPTN